MDSIYLIPSVYAHIINGILLLISILLLYKNYSKIINSESYKLIILTLLLSISFGIHGISHIFLEKYYGYNPIFSFFYNK